jgi:hypothetical protein
MPPVRTLTDRALIAAIVAYRLADRQDGRLVRLLGELRRRRNSVLSRSRQPSK